MDENSFESSNFNPAYPVVLAAVLAILLYALHITVRDYTNTGNDVEPPAVVYSLLNSIVSSHPESATELGGIIESHFSPMEYTTPDLIAQQMFAVFYRQGMEYPEGYRITLSKQGVVEVLLTDIDGNPMYPKVMLVYKLSRDDGKISTYNIGRLQPLDTNDEEYSELWT